ncbi:MAG: GspH/FimT family pseudopilin [Acidobacteria bacterium]|nr:GspH/FimT family pseudopilin [Acidobacteriota bacterium]
MRNDNKGRNQAAQGITLMEMLVVVALVSILLAVVFPAAGSGLATLALRSAAQEVATAAKYAREQAIYRQRFFMLEMDGEARTVSVVDLESGRTRSFRLPETVRVDQILSVRIGETVTSRSWLFFPDGSSDPFQVVLQTRQRRVQISSDPLTGYPEVSWL